LQLNHYKSQEQPGIGCNHENHQESTCAKSVQYSKGTLDRTSGKFPETHTSCCCKYRQNEHRKYSGMGNYRCHDQEHDCRQQCEGGHDRQRCTDVERSFPLLPSHASDGKRLQSLRLHETSPCCSILLGFVDSAATDHRTQNLGFQDLGGGHGCDVTVENDEVGKHAWIELPFLLLIEFGERRTRGVCR